MNYSVGLIGLGKIGALYDINNQNIMSHLKAIIRDDRFDLGFAYDPNVENCDFIKMHYNISNVYNDLQSLKLINPKIDLLVVASPTECHFDSILSLLTFVNPKVILCEKPLTESLIDAQNIMHLCNKENIKIVTNFMRRSLPIYKKLKRKITSQFPSQYDTVIKYSGCFKNNGSHFVDLMSFFYGTPEDILQKTSKTDSNSFVKVRATVMHKNAICTYIPMTSHTVINHEVEIMTDKFKLTFSRAGRDIKIYNAGEDEDFAGAYQYGLEENVKSDYLNFQKHVYNDMYITLKSGTLTNNLCDIKRSLENIKFIEEL